MTETILFLKNDSKKNKNLCDTEKYEIFNPCKCFDSCKYFNPCKKINGDEYKFLDPCRKHKLCKHHKSQKCFEPCDEDKCEIVCVCHCRKHHHHKKPKHNTQVRVQNLVSNLLGTGLPADPNLVNAWGNIIIDDIVYVSDNGSGNITTYDLNGIILPVIISVQDTTLPAKPTGLIHNTTTGFIVPIIGVPNLPALLLTATENGTISGYVPQYPGTQTLVVYISPNGAIYKGLTIATDYLYAADFYNNKIDVFDNKFNLISVSPTVFPFIDPTLPTGFAPFNIFYANNLLYVLYAKQLLPNKYDDEAGPGFGFISIFLPNGIFVKRLVSGGPLNSPWGIILAPEFLHLPAGSILVGNFGDGFINIFDSNGTFLGRLKDCNGVDVNIDGLWGLSTIQHTHLGRLSDIFFTAGPNHEKNGLLGKLVADCRK
jgi:uncharacterized protein (TIGR03118 family)